MTPATIAPRGDASVANIIAVQHGPMIVATDGSKACDAALTTASRLAALHHSKVTVLSVVEPIVTVPSMPESRFRTPKSSKHSVPRALPL